MSNLFDFKGYFAPGDPGGDSLIYLKSTEKFDFVETVAQALCRLYYPRILVRQKAAKECIEIATAKSMAFLQQKAVDLDKLEESIIKYSSDYSAARLKRRSKNSQYIIEFEISNIDAADYAETLSVIQSGKFGRKRYLLSRAIATLFHPLALMAFGDPRSTVISSIFESRIVIRDEIASLYGGRAFSEKLDSSVVNEMNSSATEYISMPADEVDLIPIALKNASEW
jgi:hypothetical protein